MGILFCVKRFSVIYGEQHTGGVSRFDVIHKGAYVKKVGTYVTAPQL